MNILFPVGRMIGGSLAKTFQATDNKGNPKMNAAGEPQMRCNFGVAIPKGPEKGWWETSWGQDIYKAGVEGFPKGEYNNRAFAWKVTDGDSQEPNKKGKRPCDQTGYPGNWVIWFSQSWLPKKVNNNATQELTDPEAIVPGYFIQVYGDVVGNGSYESPGVYLNPVAVALVGYGERIASDVDVTAVGFGKAPLPAGASATPIGMTTPGPGMGGPGPGMTTPGPGMGGPGPGMTTPGPGMGGPGPGMTTPGPGMGGPGLPAGVVPNPGFLNGPPAFNALPTYQMTAKAQGTREQYIAAGWTDALLIQHGLMIEEKTRF